LNLNLHSGFSLGYLVLGSGLVSVAVSTLFGDNKLAASQRSALFFFPSSESQLDMLEQGGLVALQVVCGILGSHLFFAEFSSRASKFSMNVWRIEIL
jgi:hypothetical protein